MVLGWKDHMERMARCDTNTVNDWVFERFHILVSFGILVLPGLECLAVP